MLQTAPPSDPLAQPERPDICLTTSEQMYFLGAPVAHCLAYIDQMRADRIKTGLRRWR